MVRYFIINFFLNDFGTLNSLNSKKNAAFSIMEIIIVLAIIAMLATAAVNYYQGTVEQAREVTVRNNLRAVRSAIEMYCKRNLEGPTSFSQLELSQSVEKMLLYQLQDPDARIQLEIPDFTGYPGVAENVLVASHFTWSTPLNNGQEGIGKQFRNLRIYHPTGRYNSW